MRSSWSLPVKASDSRRLRRVLNAEPGGCRWSSTTPEPTTDEGARAQRGREPNRPPSAAVSAGREPSSLPCTPPYIFLLGRKKINRVGRRRPNAVPLNGASIAVRHTYLASCAFKNLHAYGAKLVFSGAYAGCTGSTPAKQSSVR